MSARAKTLEAVFHAAMDLSSPEERGCYLTRACAGDPELRREVDELLRSAAVADQIFQAGREACVVPEIFPTVVLTEKPGDLIGRYKLLERIGEGGMGVVYMAEQEHPVRRKVALKIIKLGMDTRQVIARFEAERQALALMDHPHIARVLDGGATDAGRPYFVMDLVQGVPITQFCETNQLSIEERLKLFIPVCQAIQSAHQKGIIHRDLKPSNVLLTMHNGAAHPMVIDFGVAKATNQKLAEKTLFTHFATMIGTPAYMSPEQAEMSRTDVDTRSDIYSLGVLLYELLTGTTPFPEERLRSLGYGEMQRVIAEEAPERPSTRLRSKSFIPSTNPNTPRPASLPADLDWIVMKCLEKDRNRRYETATGLASDLQAHLNDEPVVARPPSTMYRFRKFVRRNKLAFAAALAVTVALLGGIAATSWQALRAKEAEYMATAEAATASAVKNFLTDQLFKANPYETPASNHANRRILLDEIAQAIEGRFAEQPLVELEIREALATGLIGFGEHSKVIRQAERMLELRRRQYPPGHSDILEDLGYLAINYMDAGRRDNGEQLLAEIEASLPAQGELSTGAAVGLVARATLRRAQGRPSDGLPDLERAIPIFVRAYGPTEHRVVNIIHLRALMTHEAGQTQEAERLWSDAARHFERLLGPDHPSVARLLMGYAYTLRETQRPEQAIPILERATSILRQSLPEGHGHLLDAEDVLARSYELTGDVTAAYKLYSRTYPHWIRLLPTGVSVNHCQGIAGFFVRYQHYEDAKRIYEALRTMWEINPPENLPQFESCVTATAATRGWPAATQLYRSHVFQMSSNASALRNAGSVLLYASDTEGYLQLVRKTFPLALTTTNIDEQRRFAETVSLGPLSTLADELNQVRALLHSLEGGLSAGSTNRAALRRTMGALQLRLGNFEDSLVHLESASKSLRTGFEAARVLALKAIVLQRLGRFEEARAAFEQSEGLMKSSLLDDLPGREPFLRPYDECTYLVLRREAQAVLGLNP